MSTIPTTLNDPSVPYTVVGGGKGAPASRNAPVTLVVLERGPRLFRAEALRDSGRMGFDSVIIVEEPGELFDVESLCQRHPGLRFLLLGAPADPGTRINLAVREAATPFVFVLWSDMGLSSAGLSGRFFERLVEQDKLCTAPFLSTPKGGLLPTAATPALHGSSLKILPLAAARDGAKTLYPFDYAGIYSRERFILLGGYDGRLGNPFWQRLDFGFRAWLWGEEIRLSQALRVSYEEGPAPEDSTVDASYRWFWLKNLAPRFRGDSSILPAGRFPEFLLSGRRDPFGALRDFRAAREWVGVNSYRFRSDAASVVDLWEDEER